MASALIPLAASVLGPVMGRIFGGDGVKKACGMSMMGGEMTRMAGGMRRRRSYKPTKRGGKVRLYKYGRGMKGKGIADIFRKVLKYGKLAFKVAKNKKVRGLVKHGINTYKDVKNEIKSGMEKPEEGEGRKLRHLMKRRWAKRIKIRKGRGMDEPVSGPLP